MKKRIGEKNIWLWNARFILLLCPVFFVGGIFSVFFPKLLGILFVGIVFFCPIIIWWYFPALRRNTFLILYEDHLEWHSGLIFQMRSALSFQRILYLRLSQNLIERIFGLCTLTLHPAGRPIRMRGLNLEDGLSIKENLEDLYG